MADKKKQQQPLDILRGVEQRCIEHATGLPLQAESKKTTLAIAFRVGGLQMVAPMEEVKEILSYPDVSQIPRTKRWMKGIANVRGMLLPVMDLQGCLGKGEVVVNKKNRVLVINYQDAVAGLVVDEVLGLKHFLDEDYTRELPDVAEVIQQHLVGAYRQGNEYWGIFSMHSLAESPQFMQVAV